MCTLECRELRKQFSVKGRPVPVLDGVGFSVDPGETVVVSGRSGEGKSVLMWLLSGIDRPDSGDVLIEGVSLGGLGHPALCDLRRRKVGLVFQTFNLIETWTALENVMAALAGGNLAPGVQRDTAASLLGRLGLADRLDNLPCQLSVGQQQRVAVARALVANPALLIADEPCGDVDPETAGEVVTLLESYVREHKAAMVVATHGSYPLAGASRVLRLSGGRIAHAAP